jgi:hypothetical protein
LETSLARQKAQSVADRPISLSGFPFVQFAIDFSPEIAAYKGSATRAKFGTPCADERRALRKSRE